MTKLIYCADGNPRFAKIAIEQGFQYGAQLPNTIYYAPYFVDQDWRNPDREKYMAALKQHKPALATVLDWEQQEQLSEVLSWADEAAQYVNESVIIIPKVQGGINQLPREIRGKQIRLGYSVPTSFAGTELPIWDFIGWPVHLLGGSPDKQLMISNYLNVASTDGNYSVLLAQYGKYWTRVRDIKWLTRVDDGIYKAFRMSCANICAAWNDCRALIRYASEKDIPCIKQIANQYKSELGFVNSAALKTSTERFELLVAEYQGVVVGFVNFHTRRDNWHTVYEIAVHRAYREQHIGHALLQAVPFPRRLKCTLDNPANGFYQAIGMKNVGIERGKRQGLNIWEAA